MTDSLRFAVLGPGGVGGLVAAALHRAGTPVTIVAREQTADLISDRGVRVESIVLGDFAEPVPAGSRLVDAVDVLVIATKAGGLDAALQRVDDGAVEDAVIVPLLNGLEHLPRLRDRFGDRVAAATIRVEADRPEPGRVVHTSKFLRIDLASDGDVPRQRLESIAEAFDSAGIRSAVGDSEAQVMWSKLTRLCALAVTTSAFGTTIGPIREDPEMRAALAGCAGEAAAAARAEGADIRAEVVMAELDQTHATLGSSMQRDIAAGRAPELEAIPGAVVRAAARHGLECPTIETLSAQIRKRISPPGEAGG